jgi:CubicO group peptidase (beta-lactamase class C family)
MLNKTAINLHLRWLIFFLFGAAINTFCWAQKSNSKINLQTLEYRIPGILDSAHIPGLTIAIIDKGKLIWSKGFGVVDKESNIKVDEQTIFPAASLGKPVFAYAVLKMMNEGKLHLDSTIASSVPLEYLEKSFLKGKLLDENIKLITPRMILSHSSGLPNWRNSGEPIKTLFKPGEKYSYSGEAYFLLQLLVEYIMKQPIEKVMESYVFQPLGMQNSTYLLCHSAHYTSTYGNDGKFVPIDTLETTNVAHTFKSNANDYARFIIALMKGSGLSKATSKEMFSPQVTTDICQTGKISWALGFAIQNAQSENSFFQWGKSPNSSSYFIGFKDSERAIVYFTNIANQGLRIGEVLVQMTLAYQDPLFACFGVKQYNSK